MALEEATTTPGEMNAQAREAHLLRTRNRIAYWRGQLNPLTGEPSEAIKSLAVEELGKYERQLREPLTARTLKTLPQAIPSPIERLVTTLQREVSELKEKLLGTPETPSVAEPVALAVDAHGS